jgi:tetratricopeptide (TPR) repeat protein
MATPTGGVPFVLPHRWVLVVAAALAPAPAVAQSVAAPSADSLSALLRIAHTHHYRGALADALGVLARAESLVRHSRPTPERLARVWIARADVWVSQTTATNAGYAAADTAAAQAIALAERSADARLRADAADVAGRILYSRRINLSEGDYERPLAHFERALRLRRSAGDLRGEIESLFRVGLIHERKDESDKAIAIYEEGMRLAGNGYPLERSNIARHLAYQHQGRGDLDRALELFTQSLELREQAGFVLTRPSALTSIGDLHRRRGDYRMALDFGRRALAEAERLGATRFVVGALLSLGQTHAAAGERNLAQEHFDRAASLAERIDFVSGVTRAREEAAKLER